MFLSKLKEEKEKKKFLLMHHDRFVKIGTSGA